MDQPWCSSPVGRNPFVTHLLGLACIDQDWAVEELGVIKVVCWSKKCGLANESLVQVGLAVVQKAVDLEQHLALIIKV